MLSYMKTTILIIFLFSTIIVCGQKDTTTKTKWYEQNPADWVSPKTVVDSKFCIKLAPLTLLGNYNGPSVRLGAEYKLKDTWSLHNELGYFIGNTGAITKIELKHYLDYLDKNVGIYLSAELAYKYQHYQTTDTIAIMNQTNLQITKYEKDYFVTKHVECLTIKFGYLKVYKLGIVLDIFGGAGIRVKQAKNTLTSDENKNIKHSSDYGPNVFTNEAGNKIYPNIDLGVKIGYRIK